MILICYNFKQIFELFWLELPRKIYKENNLVKGNIRLLSPVFNILMLKIAISFKSKYRYCKNIIRQQSIIEAIFRCFFVLLEAQINKSNLNYNYY